MEETIYRLMAVTHKGFKIYTSDNEDQAAKEVKLLIIFNY